MRWNLYRPNIVRKTEATNKERKRKGKKEKERKKTSAS